MSENRTAKVYDSEERTYQFAKAVCIFCKGVPSSLSNLEYSKQLIRSSGSVGANYIEAWESLGKRDFLMKMKICRKEAKESAYWIRLIAETNDDARVSEGKLHFDEANELKKIFSAIIAKSS